MRSLRCSRDVLAFAEFEDQSYGVVEHRVVLVGVGVGAVGGDTLVFRRFEEALHIFGLTLVLPELDDGSGLFSLT